MASPLVGLLAASGKQKVLTNAALGAIAGVGSALVNRDEDPLELAQSIIVSTVFGTAGASLAGSKFARRAVAAVAATAATRAVTGTSPGGEALGVIKDAYGDLKEDFETMMEASAIATGDGGYRFITNYPACPTCEALDGRKVSGPDSRPHPNCDCEIREIKEDKPKTKPKEV